ncbi:mitochondrial carrier domain-containing protein [Phlyctochytrium arcticum]|nr:mitochondrial carrier domain-containing protein [Phlyctochytrium arcticum]
MALAEGEFELFQELLAHQQQDQSISQPSASASKSVASSPLPINDSRSPLSQNGQVFSPPPSATNAQKLMSACSGAILTSLIVTPFDVVKTRMQSSVDETNSHRYRKQASQGHARNPWVIYPRQGDSSTVEKHTTHRHTSHNIPTQTHTPHSSSLQSSTAFSETLKNSNHSSYRHIPIFVHSHGTNHPPIQIHGTWDGVVKIFRTEGLWALWRGLSPTLLMSVPSTVVYYMGYEQIRDWIGSRDWSMGERIDRNGRVHDPWNVAWAPLLAGATARTGAATLISPIELIRTRMQSLTSHSTSVLNNTSKDARPALPSVRNVIGDVRGMVREQGWTVLWRGLAPTLWRDVPFSAIYWIGYEGIKKRLEASSPATVSISPNAVAVTSTATEFRNAFIAGASSGTIAAVLTTPFDVAKTRQQISSSVHTSSTLKVLRDIHYNEGWAGVFRGLSPRVAKVAPACAVMISSYEIGKLWFAGGNRE